MKRPRSFLSILRLERAFAALALALLLLHTAIVSAGMAQAAARDDGPLAGMILCMPEDPTGDGNEAALPDHCICVPCAPPAIPPSPASSFARRRSSLRLVPRRVRPADPPPSARRLRPPGRAPPAYS
jgi:hypothetical protein